MLEEFKKFIMRGNVLDLAVGVIIVGAFGKIVTSFVNDIFMPPIGLLLGRVDFTNVFITLTGDKFTTLAAAQEAGALTMNIGLFINAIVNFLIVALAVFLIVKALKPKPKPQPAAAPATKECPFCITAIPIEPGDLAETDRDSPAGIVRRGEIESSIARPWLAVVMGTIHRPCERIGPASWAITRNS